jgi:hypothetical protein
LQRFSVFFCRSLLSLNQQVIKSSMMEGLPLSRQALYIDSSLIRLAEQKGGVVATIPASAVTEISYGQDVHRRVGTAIGLAVVSLGIGALMLLSKSKKHFAGLTWVDGDKQGGFVTHGA